MASSSNNTWREASYSPNQLTEAIQTYASLPDSLVTLNRFWGPRRRVASIAELGAVFCDIDFYKRPGLEGYSPEHAYGCALQILEEERIPAPTMATSTGRGLTVTWTFAPVPRQALPRWNAVQRRVAQVLAPLGADQAAKDAARLIRVAGSVNSKSGRPARIIAVDQSSWSFDSLADEILPITRVELQALREGRRRYGPQGSSRLPSAFSGATLWEARLEDLQTLLRLRHQGALPPGHRDTWLFLASVAMSWLVEPSCLEREIVALANEVTDGEWDQAETKTRMCTVVDKAKLAAEGKKVEWNGRLFDPRYRLKTETILEWLDITASEQKWMTTLVNMDIARERKRVYATNRVRVSSSGVKTGEA